MFAEEVITEGPCDVATKDDISKMNADEYAKYAQWKKDCEAEERTTPLSTNRLESYSDDYDMDSNWEDDYHGDMSQEEYDQEVDNSQMEYAVWVGGTEVNDKWLTYDEALALYDKYKAQGYDDIKLDARIKKVKEGSFWGRDDMVKKMKDGEKASGMKKFVKIDDKGNHHGTSTSDKAKWKELIAQGYEEDKGYYDESLDEWVQEPHEGQKWSGQERNFIQELCLRMDGVSKSPEGLKWMGKSKTWDEGNVLSDKGKLTTVMLWAKRNIDDLYDRMGSEFKVYSDGNDEGDSGRGQSDGNQIIQNIIGKIGSVEEAAKPDFLDLDKDGDKKEPMKKAAKDKERTDEILPAIAIGTMAGALMSDRKAKRDAEQLNAEKGDDSEEAVAARDEFLKVMDMKPKTPGPGKQIDTIKKIVADKQNMQVAFDDGKMRVDLYTASAVSQVYDAVKPETQVKIDNMLRTKAGMLKMSDFAFSKFNEGLKEGKQLDEILPALAMAARAVAPAVGQALKGVAKAAVKNPVKTAQVVKTVKSDKPVTQKAAGVAKITGVTEEELEELQAPYTGADAVIDQNGKKHKPGSSKANMIVNMKRKPAKAAVKNPVAVPLQKNKSGVKKPAPAVGRGNAVGSKATQIQPGGGSAAGKTAAANTAKIKQAKRGAMVGKVKAVGKKVGGFVKNQALKSLDRSGIGNPLAASKQYADDMVEDAIKKAEQELEEFTPKPSIPKGPMPSFKVTRVPSTKPKGQTPGDHHPPLRLKAKMHF